MNLFHPNTPLKPLIERDPGVHPDDKALFAHLADPANYERDQIGNLKRATEAVHLANAFCRLFLRNYIWIEGFPPPPVADRSKWANRKRALKAIFTGVL